MPFWGSSQEGINYKIGVSDILRTWSSCLNYFKMTFIQMFKKLFLARWCLHGTFQFGCFQQKKRKHHSDDWYVNNDQRWCDLGFPKSIALKGRLHNWSNPLEVSCSHCSLFLSPGSLHRAQQLSLICNLLFSKFVFPERNNHRISNIYPTSWRRMWGRLPKYVKCI